MSISLTTEQYLALADFANNNFSQADVDSHLKISQILGDEKRTIKDRDKPVLAALSTTNADGVNLSNWTLAGMQTNTDSGFAGMAF